MSVLVSRGRRGRTTAPPEPSEDERAAFLAKAQELAPQYRTELLRP